MGNIHPACIALNRSTGCLFGKHHNTQGRKTGPGGAALALHASGMLYLAGNKGMAVFDTRDLRPGTGPGKGVLPRVGGVINTSAITPDGGCRFALHPDGGLLYLVGGKGLAVFDLSDPAAPRRIGNVIKTGALSNLTGGAACVLHEGHLFIAGAKGLAIYNVARDLRAPRKVGHMRAVDTQVLSYEGGISLKIIKGQRNRTLLYVLSGEGLGVLDVSEPGKPKVVTTLDTGCVLYNGCPCISGSGSNDVLFLAGGKALGILDATAPHNPRLVQTMNTGVMSTGAGCAMVTDVSNQLYGHAETLLIAGGRGLGAFALPPARDMLAGTKPHRRGKLDTGVLSHDNESAILLDARARRLYVAGGDGLAAFDLTTFDGATLDQTAVSLEDDP